MFKTRTFKRNSFVPHLEFEAHKFPLQSQYDNLIILKEQPLNIYISEI